jgi:hypothetical protein
MKKQASYVPVRKILNMINSCQTDEELSNCKKTVDNYVKSVAKQGVKNHEDLKTRLYEEIEQREEAIYLVNILN